MQKLLQEILAIGIENNFPPPPPTQQTIDAAVEALLTEADVALDAGDEQKSRAACVKVLSNLNCSSHFRVRVAIRLASALPNEYERSIGILQYALDELEILDPNTVPANINISDLYATASSALAKALAQSAEGDRFVT